MPSLYIFVEKEANCKQQYQKEEAQDKQQAPQTKKHSSATDKSRN
jgi:hypothetical protein